MNIIEVDYTWNGELTKRGITNYIVLHHAAGSGMTAQQIHSMHVNANGWTGIGYNFYIRKDGLCYRGRPVDVVGAHTFNYNSQSIGICAEGNYEADTMPQVQKEAIADLLRDLLVIYPQAKISKHSTFNATACPGKLFPFDEIVSLAQQAGPTAQAIAKLAEKGIIQTPDYWQINAVPGGICRGDFVSNLLRNIVGIKTGQVVTVAQAISVLQSIGVIISPEYWTANAVEGGSCKGEYVAMLIVNYAKTI